MRKIIYFIFILSIFVFGLRVQRSEAIWPLQNGKEEVKKVNGGIEEELIEIKEKYQASEKEKNFLILHIRELQGQKDQLMQLLSLIRIELEGVKKEAINHPIVKERIDQLNGEMKALLSENENLKKRVGMFRLAYEKTVSVLDQERTKLAEEILALKKKYEVKDIEDVQKKLEEDLKKKQLQMEKESEGKILSKEEELENSITQNKKLVQKLASVLREKKILERNFQALESRSSVLKGEIKQMKDQLKNVKNQYEQDIKAIEAENKKKISGGKEKDKQTVRMERELKDKEKEIKEIRKDLKNALAEKKDAQRKFKNQSADKQMTQMNVEELKGRLSAAESKLHESERSLEEERKKNQEILEKQKKENELKESKISVLQEEKAELEKKMIGYVDRLLRQAGQTGKLQKNREKGIGEVADERMKKATSKAEIKHQKLVMHYNLAIAYDKQGLYNEARKEYLECLKINSKDANVHYNLAILYDDKLNDNKRAIEHYEKYIKLRPVGEDVYQVKEWMVHAEQEEKFKGKTR